MKSSKCFLLCLLAGLFISANCAALELETTVKTSDEPVAFTPSDVILQETTPTTDPTIPTTTPVPETTAAPPDNTTTSTSSTTSTTSSSSTTTSTTSTTSTTPPTTSTISPNSTSTVSPSTSTEMPSTTTAPPVPCHRFDGSSFVGGIVLTLGLLAISLVAYKFYKARNERNYHTL